MNAMQYELLIRTAYDSERNYALGADADIYREMEKAFRDLSSKVMFATQEDREYEFRKRFATVCRHVKNALRELPKRHAISPELRELIESMSMELSFDFYDKVRLDEIIDNILTILQEEKKS